MVYLQINCISAEMQIAIKFICWYRYLQLLLYRQILSAGNICLYTRENLCKRSEWLLCVNFFIVLVYEQFGHDPSCKCVHCWVHFLKIKFKVLLCSNGANWRNRQSGRVYRSSFWFLKEAASIFTISEAAWSTCGVLGKGGDFKEMTANL